MLVNIPNELIEKMCNNDVALFIGAGLSMQAGFPSWNSLLEQMIIWSEKNDNRIDKDDLLRLLEKGEYLLVAEEIREQLSNTLFETFMRQIFQDSSKKITDVHRILTKLPVNYILTTNYDILLEDAYLNYSKLPVAKYTQEDIVNIANFKTNSNSRSIVKLHGDIERIETLILGKKGYREQIYNNKVIKYFLNAIFMVKTLLFVGASLRDPDILLILEELQVYLKGYGNIHYALMNSKEIGNIEKKSLLENYNIQVITYDATKGHPEIYEILQSIYDNVLTQKAEIVLEVLWRRIPHCSIIIETSYDNLHETIINYLNKSILKVNREYEFSIAVINPQDIQNSNFCSLILNEILKNVKLDFDIPPKIKPDIEYEGNYEFINCIEYIDEHIPKNKRLIILLHECNDIINKDSLESRILRSFVGSIHFLRFIVIIPKINMDCKYVGSPWFNVFDPIKF